MRYLSRLFMAGLFLMLAACAVKAPEVRVTGERTALEQEVLGAYEDLEEDTWMLASTRSSRNNKRPVFSPEKKRVLDAYRTIKFNKDDVDELKRKKIIGENNNGLLESRPAKENASQDVRALADSVIEEQNNARSVIVQRMIEVNPALQNTEKDEIMSEFARMNQTNSAKGTWIQMSNGTWIIK
ncbi:DUF1318 domain-containing protein [bacterium]|nr:DUF1318 domain-containing protein [bacterium]